VDPAGRAPALTRVTPTRRLAHHLRARHEETCLALGLEVWATPDIVTWDELVERMFALERRAGRQEARWLPSGAAQLVWERIVRADPELSPLVAPGGVARAAYQSWRRLHDYQVPLESLDDNESPETTAFARWCRRYQRLLEERSWMDPAQAQARVQAFAAEPGLEIVGFDRLTPLQDALLARWAAAGLEVRRVSVPSAAVAARRVSCRDRAAEVEAAARWAAACLHGSGGRRIAVVVPDLAQRRAEVRRTMERVMAPGTAVTGGPAPESQAFELAAARPLAEQPVVAAALDLLDALVRPPDLGTISRLLRNPFLAGAAEEAGARARLDARIRRFEGPGLALVALERLALERACPVLGRILADAGRIISEWPEKSLPSLCPEYIFKVLSALGWPGAGPDSSEHQAEQRWRALVSEFGACDEFFGRVTRGEALGLLRDSATRVLFEPQELRTSLLVIDPETCAGMRFDALWVCGLESGRWPPPTAPDPFLPRTVQVRGGVPRASAELAAEEARRVLDRLLASAPEVILSVPEQEDDAPLLPSPLLEGIETIDSPIQWPELRLAQAQYVRRPPLESLVDATLPPLTNAEAGRGGARLLELQAACPFRAQAELRLGARPLEEPGLGVDAAERGDLLHVALAQLWRELGDQGALRALDEAGLRAAVHRAVSAALVEARRGADGVLRHLLDLEADWLEARVHEMAEVDRTRPPFVVEAVERACTGRIGGLTLELRPDRVDRLEDGSLAVIDYKTGAQAEVRAWLDERPRLPQLPAYVQALGPARVSAVAFARVRSGDTGYAGVTRDDVQFPGLGVPGAKGGPRGFDSWEQLLAEWQRRLEALALEYAAGDARLAPDPPRACEYCRLGALCRIAQTSAVRQGEEAADE
jgi:probable DNA repair protein